MKYKTLIPLFLAIFAIAGSASVAHANDGTMKQEDSASHGWRAGRMEERREAIRDRISGGTDSMRDTLEQRGPIMREVAAARIGLGHEWIIKRLTNIVDRIDARADDLAKDGKNVADVRTHTSAARADLKIASENLAEARDTMKQAFANMKEAWDDTRDGSKNDDSSRDDLKAELKPLSDDAKADLMAARTALQSARDHIRKAIDALKAVE